MNTPLLSAVEAYLAGDRARFHMPGHKGRPLPVVRDISRYDITEVEGADSLYEASGAIAETERRYAALYGAVGSFLSAGGSTLCIQAMLTLAARPGSAVIAGRGAHISAINAMALLDLRPVWLFPAPDRDAALPCAVSPRQVEAALREHPHAACVYLTSPDYFGTTADIAAISGLCRERGVPLLVDNAHGAHLAFLEPSRHPIRLGASLCCDSLHKTLPVLTGGAVLHAGDTRFLPEVKRAMSLFGSTSPNYLILLSIDTALPYLEGGEFRRDLAACAARVAELRELAASLGYALPAKNCEPARLTLGFGQIGYTAREYGGLLRRHGVEPEYIGGSFCVLLAGAATSDTDYRKLEQALRSIPVRDPLPAAYLPLAAPEQACTVREAVFAPCARIPVAEAAGRIAGVSVSPCPPGVPVLVPGERIGLLAVQHLKNDGISHINVVQ